MRAESGELEATCADCRLKPDHCACPPLARRLILTPASEIEIEPVVWVWDDDGIGRIPAGSLGLFAGREGTGKSSFLIWLSARITTGTLPGMFFGTPRAVIYIAVEDSWKHTIAPRLKAAGADLTLVYRAEVQVIEGETVSLSLPADNKMLEEAITSYGVAMVVLDPLMSAISDSLDTHVNRQVRQALDPLARLADRTGAILAGIAHFNKSSGTDASSLITASGAFKDVARFIFGFATDPDDGSQVLTQVKNSLGRSDLPSFAYRIIEATVETTKGAAKVGRLIIDGKSERSVQDILSVKGDGDGDGGDSTAACDWLRKLVAAGPVESTDVYRAADAAGLSKDQAKRAKKKLGVVAAKDGMEGPWYWAIPEHEGDIAGRTKSAKEAKGAKDAAPSHTARSSLPSRSSRSSARAKGDSPEHAGTLPAGTDPAAALGSCTRCFKPCNRYGDGGSPLCDQCREATA